MDPADDRRLAHGEISLAPIMTHDVMCHGKRHFFTEKSGFIRAETEAFPFIGIVYYGGEALDVALSLDKDYCAAVNCNSDHVPKDFCLDG